MPVENASDAKPKGEEFLNRIIHLKLSSDSPEELTEFYGRAFEWEIERLPRPPESWRMISDGGQGINSSIHKSEGLHVDRGVSLVISVDSLDETAGRIRKAGGRTVHETISAFGNRYLYCRDPDGNMICLVELGE